MIYFQADQDLSMPCAIADAMSSATTACVHASPASPVLGLALSELDALRQAADEASALLRSLANPERLLLLCALVDGERCVGELARVTGIRQPTLSQQLGVLRAEGVVATRRDGRFVHYRISSLRALELVALLQRLYCDPATAN
jgi:DNA-binding transcriptional ArsR family regulator